jgi:hypothetical protein
VDAASAVARVYATTGQIDPAFEWLEKMVESGNGGQINPIDPGFESLSGDARWNELLERVNKAPEQLEAIEFNVRLPAEGAAVAPAPI